jgi:hypothetical protein
MVMIGKCLAAAMPDAMTHAVVRCPSTNARVVAIAIMVTMRKRATFEKDVMKNGLNMGPCTMNELQFRAITETAWRPIEEAEEIAKSNEGWIPRSLFGKMREWGWEAWVGQCDCGDLWLGRDGNGACFHTDRPSHYMPLPAPPTTVGQS